MGLPMSYWKQVPRRALVVAETGGGMIAQRCWVRKLGRQAWQHAPFASPLYSVSI